MSLFDSILIVRINEINGHKMNVLYVPLLCCPVTENCNGNGFSFIFMLLLCQLIICNCYRNN